MTKSYLSDSLIFMTRLSATEVAREFSAVVNRVGAGEEIEVIRNGIPVVEMRPASAARLVSAAKWQELMASAPAPDEDFARDVEAARKSIKPPHGAWPS
jgi:antitoxin (DNA-binding transcriptional repressor) of toxin-antitoxin stability system